ncbi:NUDIX domain-containing protein [Pseudomonas putida]|uniref:NUDIX domain-containing protein n=1 Tax=Pseudomonas putida TaxID=303 RepID=UPI0030CB4DE3
MKQRATIICRRGNQILFVRRGESKWNFPGGRPMRSESPIQAAFRELEEETGMKPAEMLLVARFETRTVEHFVFIADIEKDYFAPVPLSEITACRWCSDVANGLCLTNDSELILRTFRKDIKSI